MNIIGIMWCKNEADILSQIIEDALKYVDALLIADDDSTDKSWDIIKSYEKNLEYVARRKDTNTNYLSSQWARQHLLDEVRSRFGYKNTWIQIIESDIMILDTNIKEAISKFSKDDVTVSWHTLNAVRRNWEPEDDEYPEWSKPIKEVMPCAHWMELMTYTFRPLPGLYYTEERKPWPKGFSRYKAIEYKKKKLDSPLLSHYGYRGLKHFLEKYKNKSLSHYKNWNTSSIDSIRSTVSLFNGEWNRSSDTFKMSRKGWKQWLTGQPE